MSAIALTNYRSREAAAALFFPGFELPSMPSADDIRAAREAAGVNLRDFAPMMGGPSFKTWSMIETGQRSGNVGRIAADVWQRVNSFIAEHGKKDGNA